MSYDYRFLLGKISMDFQFAKEFFTNMDTILKNYNISDSEKLKLKSLSADRFETYRKSIESRLCDCDSCCNGGEGKGTCSECFCCCCQ